MADLIDPTMTGNYPVILGDGLLGKTSNEIFTGIRYNQKPTNSTSDARLKPSLPGKTASYDLTFSEPDGTYAFAGTRTTDDDDYVLYFDPDRKAFILDKVDSTFNMNLTRIPGNSDPEDLRRRYPHLDSSKSQKPDVKKSTAIKDKPKAAPKAVARNTTAPSKEVKRKPEKKQPKKMDLALPVPEAPKPEEPKSQKTKDEDEEEEDDDDGDLLIEYPGAESSSKQTDFSPAFPAPRRFDDFMNQRDSEADDADEESDGEPDVDFKLPSPVNHPPANAQQIEDHMEIEEEEGEPIQEDDADLEDDLEKEMENAFEELQNSGQDGSPDGDESEISEED